MICLSLAIFALIICHTLYCFDRPNTPDRNAPYTPPKHAQVRGL